MADWGTSSFENDDAQAFLAELHAKEPVELRRILTHAADVDYLQGPECRVVVAAAEIIAIAKGAPPQSVPRPIAEWISRTEGAPSAEMNELARQAVNKVRLNSELKDLWLEAEGLNDWSAVLQNLEQRLAL
jgi:Domain of unknown function (DUF4259)